MDANRLSDTASPYLKQGFTRLKQRRPEKIKWQSLLFHMWVVKLSPTVKGLLCRIRRAAPSQ